MKRLVMTGIISTLTIMGVAQASKNITPSQTTKPSLVKVQKNSEVFSVQGADGLDPKVLKLAQDAYDCAVLSGEAKGKTLTVIDYSLPSSKKRMWVINMETHKVVFNTLVAHGQGSGGLMATDFSNKGNSHQTSLGVFVTQGTYQGGNGYSLRLKGLDTGYNDKAMQRSVVMHGAPYVNENIIAQKGRLGRSWGCPAVSKELAKPIIDTIKGEGVIFAYYPDSKYLSESKYVNCPTAVLAKANSQVLPSMMAQGPVLADARS